LARKGHKRPDSLQNPFLVKEYALGFKEYPSLSSGEMYALIYFYFLFWLVVLLSFFETTESERQVLSRATLVDPGEEN